MSIRLAPPLTIALLSLVTAALPACSGDDGTSYGGDTAAGSATDGSASGASGAGEVTGAGSDGSAGSGGTSGTSGASGGDSASAGETGGTGGDPTDGTTGDTSGTTGDTTGDTTGEPACDAETPVILYLSPDDSNSMSSPVQVRESVLSEWASLYGVPIRAWEFFNYYTFGYPAAPAGQVVVTPELYQVEGAPEGEYVLQIGVSSPALDNAARPPMNITLVLDESGSMSGTPMDMEKESCRAIAASLKAGDVVSMVGWDTENAVKLAGYKVAGPNDPNLLAKIEALEAGGGTDLHGGLVAGYELAQQVYDPARINRIVLISDGGANAGITDIDTIAMAAGDNNGDGVYMVGVGVGEAGYNDALMDAVTDAGKGASVFIPNKEEAWKVFGDDFVNTMAVAARDVQVRLDLPPGFEIVKFSGEEYSADPEEVEPQHLAPNDAMVFHQTIATCAPQLVGDETMVTVTARYKDAVTFEQKEVSAQVSFGALLGEASPLIRKGKAVFEYTEALKATRDNAADAKTQVDAAIGHVDVALAANPGDADLAEIKSILQAL